MRRDDGCHHLHAKWVHSWALLWYFIFIYEIQLIKGFGFNKILIVTKQMKYLNQKNLNNAFKYASVLIAAVRALHHQIIGGLVLLLVGPRRLRYLHVCHHPHPYIRCDSTLQRVSTQSNWKFNKNNFRYFINWNWYI